MGNSDASLFPNQFVNARLRVDTLNNAILIPTVAIQYNGQQAFVYKVKPDQTSVIQNITVVNSEQHQSAVVGLNAGELVITSNFDRVQDGAQVTVAGVHEQANAASKPGAGPR